jgi:hypothetical protein
MEQIGYGLLAIALVVAFLAVSHATWRRNNWWGIDPNRPVCARCGTARPIVRLRKPSFKEWCWADGPAAAVAASSTRTGGNVFDRDRAASTIWYPSYARSAKKDTDAGVVQW